MKPTNLNQGTSSYGAKQRIFEESKQQKLQKARLLRTQGSFYESIQMYHKVIFLSEKPEYFGQIAEIYQKQLMDISSAISFYRRALHLKPKNPMQTKLKLKELSLIKGLQLLQMRGCKNILDGAYLQDQKDSNYQLMQQFRKIYPQFHQRLIATYIRGSIGQAGTSSLSKVKFIPKSPIKDHLQSCLAYLQVNSRQFAFEEVQNCLATQDGNLDLLVLKALLNWSMLQKEKGYKQFWNAYKINNQHPEVSLFLSLITPKVYQLYKEAKYDLIQKNVEKCKLKVLKGLEMYPYHTDLLILKAFLHRSSQQYKQALDCLETANNNLQNKQKAAELKAQISLTYNQMAIYLYKQQKYNQAIDLFTEGLNYKPNDYGLYTNRGDCHKAMNQFVKALEDYLSAYQFEKKSNQLNFRISSIYSIRGVSLFNSKNYQLALKQFQESLRFTPKNQQFILSKAKCLIQLNRKKQSIQLLAESLQRNPSFNQIKLLINQTKQPQEKRGPNNRKIIQLSKQKS